MKKQFLYRALGIGLTSLMVTIPAQAHYLWSTVKPGDAPTFRLTFSDSPSDEIEGPLMEHVQKAQSWTPGGPDLKLTLKDGYLTSPLPANTTVAAAGYTWGAFQINNAPVFINFYSKGATNLATAATAVQLPVEIFARIDGDGLLLTVNKEGKPAPKAEVGVILPGEMEGETFTTNDEGQVRLTSRQTGIYSIWTSIDGNAPIVQHGKSYSRSREYSTLTFSVPAP
jgi:hypothetical protein